MALLGSCESDAYRLRSKLRDLGLERPDQAAVQPAEHRPARSTTPSSAESSSASSIVARATPASRKITSLTKKASVWSMTSLVGGQVLQPDDRVVVVAGQRDHRADAERFVALGGKLECLQRAGVLGGGPGQQLLDLARQRPGGLELLAGLRVLRGERVVDQQHHPLVRVFLQRRRQQGVADDPLFLLVGRDDRRQRRASSCRRTGPGWRGWPGGASGSGRRNRAGSAGRPARRRSAW